MRCYKVRGRLTLLSFKHLEDNLKLQMKHSKRFKHYFSRITELLNEVKIYGEKLMDIRVVETMVCQKNMTLL